MSTPRAEKNPATLETMPAWSRQTMSTEYGSMSLRTGRVSVRRTCTTISPASAIFLISDSILASECQLPDTSRAITNSLPSADIRLSMMLPPQSEIARVRSCTMPVRSLPMAERARSCFIRGGGSAGLVGGRFYPAGSAGGKPPS